MPPFGPDLVRNVDYIEPCNVSAEADRFTSRIIFQGELTWSMDGEKADRHGRYDYNLLKTAAGKSGQAKYKL